MTGGELFEVEVTASTRARLVEAAEKAAAAYFGDAPYERSGHPLVVRGRANLFGAPVGYEATFYFHAVGDQPAVWATKDGRRIV